MKVPLLALLVSSTVGCVADGLEGNPADEEGGETSTVDQASVSEGFIAGVEDVRDDFGDEGPLDANSHPRSLATGMWQAILWADGARKSNGAAFDESDIDCSFGPNTTAATRDWQAANGANTDGSAGRMTLSIADNFLVIQGTTSSGSTEVRYRGFKHDVFFLRKEGSGSANHAYQAKGTDDQLRVISYGFISSCSSSFFLGL